MNVKLQVAKKKTQIYFTKVEPLNPFEIICLYKTDKICKNAIYFHWPSQVEYEPLIRP